MAFSFRTSHEPTADAELDHTALERLRQFGGEKLLRELVRLFLEHAPARLAAARAGCGQGDADGVRRDLHVLKSSAGQLGATAVQRFAQSGETRAASGRLEHVPALLDAIEAELALVLQRLRAAARVP